MNRKIEKIISIIFGIMGFVISFGTVGMMESDTNYPFAKAFTLVFVGLMFIGIGIAVGRWDQCE